MCIHCGEEGGDEFLLKTSQLQNRSMTRGHKYVHIHVPCLESGKKVVKVAGKNEMCKLRAEHITIATSGSD